MRILLLLSMVAASLVAVAPALGDDFAPPPWRGDPGSSWAVIARREMDKLRSALVRSS